MQLGSNVNVQELILSVGDLFASKALQHGIAALINLLHLDILGVDSSPILGQFNVFIDCQLVKPLSFCRLLHTLTTHTAHPHTALSELAFSTVRLVVLKYLLCSY